MEARRTPWLRTAIALVLGLIVVVGGLSTTSTLVAPAQAAPKKKKKKLSRRAMKKKMNRWAREIGVKCTYCHVKEGDEFDYKKSTPKKKIGHYCEENFVEKLLTDKKRKVSCQTCHKRKIRFLPRPKKEPQ